MINRFLLGALVFSVVFIPLVYGSTTTFIGTFGSNCQLFVGSPPDPECNTLAPGAIESGDGQFNSPRGVTTNSADRIIVADRNNHRIQIFDSDGNFLTKFGSGPSSADGEFYNPSGVTTNSTGHIIVADSQNARIQIFDSDGNFLTKFGSGGTGDGEFIVPQDVTTNSTDHIIVADTYEHRIQIFDSDGNFLTKFGSGSSSSADGEFSFPHGITTNSKDHIIVADTFNDRIQIFDSDGNFLTKFGSGGTADGNFIKPFGVTTNSTDHIIVADSNNDRIQIFDSDGNFLTKFGSGPSSDVGKFRFPVGVTTNSTDHIIVADTGNRRIQIFSYGEIASSSLSSPRGDSGGSSRGSDAIPPTLGKTVNGFQIVENGFSFNGLAVDAGRLHTEYPLIQAKVGELNTISTKIYENSGPSAIRFVEFALGAPAVGDWYGAEAYIEVWMEDGSTDVKEIVIDDDLNLIDSNTVNAETSKTKCRAESHADDDCLLLDLDYMYREAPLHNVVGVKPVDTKGYGFTYYFNDGIEVIGESMNPAAQTEITASKGTYHPQKKGYLQLTQIDRGEKLWEDQYGIHWQIDGNVVKQLTQPDYVRPVDNSVGKHLGMDRMHPLFDQYKYEQRLIAMKTLEKILGSSNTDVNKPMPDYVRPVDNSVGQHLGIDRMHPLFDQYKYEQHLIAMKTLEKILGSSTDVNKPMPESLDTILFGLQDNSSRRDTIQFQILIDAEADKAFEMKNYSYNYRELPQNNFEE